MNKLFKIFLSVFFVVGVFIPMYVFQDSIVKKHYDIYIFSSFAEKTKIRLIDVDTNAFFSENVDKSGLAHFSISDKNISKFRIDVKDRVKLEKIIVAGEKKQKIFKLKKDSVFNISVPPKTTYFYHRFIIPLLCLIWLIWGIFYKKNNTDI